MTSINNVILTYLLFFLYLLHQIKMNGKVCIIKRYVMILKKPMSYHICHNMLYVMTIVASQV